MDEYANFHINLDNEQEGEEPDIEKSQPKVFPEMVGGQNNTTKG